MRATLTASSAVTRGLPLVSPHDFLSALRVGATGRSHGFLCDANRPQCAGDHTTACEPAASFLAQNSL
jgi:hypothetical protein